MDLLKLTAVDQEDLEILSAHMQDAVLRVGDVTYQPCRRRFALVANRFDWQGLEAHNRKTRFQRRRTSLHFEYVLRATSHKIQRHGTDAVLSLLNITFEPDGDGLSGHILLTFSGGGMMRLHVECIDAHLTDLGPVWETSNQPTHEGSGDATETD